MNRFSHSHLWPGVPLALGSAILFGATAPLSKLLLGHTDPQMLAGLLYLSAGIGLAGVHVVRRAFGVAAPEAPLRRADAPWLAAVILFGGILGPLLLMIGLDLTNAASGSLLLNLEGLATMGIAWVVFRENVDRRLLLGALAILVGAGILSWEGRGISVDLGAAFIAAACLAWGIDNNLTRKLSSSDPVQITLAKGLAAGAANIGIAVWRGASMPSFGVTSAAGVVGFLGVGVSLVLFILALRHLGAARTGAYFALAPFIGAVVAVGVLDEPLTLKLVLAGAFMAVGLWLHLAERHAHEHHHDVLEHEHSHVHNDGDHDHGHEGSIIRPHSQPHSHWHRHEPLRHKHVHYPDLHHRHDHQHS